MPIQIQHDPNFTEQRRAVRASAPMEISIRERSRSAVAAKIADLSSNGCQLVGGGLLMAGTQLWVRLPGLESMVGNIVWSQGDRAGVIFASPLHPVVAARFVGGQAANDMGTGPTAAPGGATPVMIAAPLLSRREQIAQGLVDTEISPLVRRKQPSGLGLSGRIARRVRRQVNHRHEQRYADGVSTGPGGLHIAGLPATIANVSASGMKLRGEQELAIGKRVDVMFDGFDPIKATVVWARDGEFGISLPENALDLAGSSGAH